MSSEQLEEVECLRAIYGSEAVETTEVDGCLHVTVNAGAVTLAVTLPRDYPASRFSLSLDPSSSLPPAPSSSL